MSRLYSVVLNGTVTAAGTDADLLSFAAAANKPIRLRRLILSQYSEVGDAQEESIRITIKRLPATVTPGSGGAAITPQLLDENDAAAGFTARGNDTTPATTSGTAVTLEDFGWNERNTPFEMVWMPEMAPRVQNAGSLVVKMESTLADDISASVTAIVEEY